ncbi:prion-like-(Q/N-rich) domain-bearing protein 25 [Plodia interpunctella]|uniref:prion-like-(Q/N-rich) domain-bearing protein 25 n=1 Tax=Plodia interpunctella TaxID=58824 RepID=UPI0023677F60|nr:prion-like-(Q/N-rich) domain-bearing protein 25 [Plodia interpunctella]
MFGKNPLCVVVLLSVTKLSITQWTCTSNEQCGVEGSLCVNGACACPTGQQVVSGGTACADIAPYHASSCVDDFQCSNLFNSFECRRGNPEGTAGKCFCQQGHHYRHGRCWRTIDFGDACSVDDECMSPTMMDPSALTCDGTCQCAEGYYLRQRGECRKIAHAVGDGCVLNQDCQFEGGLCDQINFQCVNQNDIPASSRANLPTANVTSNITLYTTNNRAHSTSCDMLTPCPEPFICSTFGACVCPSGYYLQGTACLAELGSPSTEAQCQGLMAIVVDGVCACPNNFFFGEDMRNCEKVARTRNDACTSDMFCRTFGAMALCGEPQQWGLRSCECDPERAVWDEDRQMCRLFAGIGEQCEVNSDCLAGELEITCVVAADDVGYCACPEGLTEFEGLCLTSGLGLGDPCQATIECTATENTICLNGNCTCGDGYQALDDFCAPIIGGSCNVDSDCVIEHTLCHNETRTCQCGDGFVAYDDVCWPSVSGINAECNVTEQCRPSLGDNSVCLFGSCVCENDYHYRDGRCWARIGLFEVCGSTSECFLAAGSELTECRNGLCQCHFDFSYSEQSHTCLSSATSITAGITSIITVIYLFLR